MSSISVTVSSMIEAAAPHPEAPSKLRIPGARGERLRRVREEQDACVMPRYVCMRRVVSQIESV